MSGLRWLLLGLFSYGLLQAQPAVQQSYEDGPFRLSLSVDRNQITAAEAVELTLHVEYPEDAEVAIPASRDELGEFLVESFAVEPPRLVADGTLAIAQHMTLAPAKAGDLVIPALRASATLSDGRMLSLGTEDVLITVSSLLAATEDGGEPALRDIAEPLEAPIPLAWKLGALLAVLAVIASLFWLHRRRKNKQVSPAPAVVIPPGEAALRRLDDLAAGGLLEEGDYRRYHFELSDILRQYIERRFSIRAQEQTTDEFLARLPSHRVFNSQQQVLLQDFLQRSDLVKFAKYAPPAEQSRDAAQACRLFIVETDAVRVATRPVE